MTRRDGSTLLKRLVKRFSIGLGTMALMLIAASAQVSGGAGTVLAKVAHAGEIASSEVADTLHMIDVQFALSEPLYRDTDRGDAILILALVFSGIVAFNIWFFRHLHGTPPRGKPVAAPQTADSPPQVPSFECRWECAAVVPFRV